jgi:hypothetical protein
MAFSAPHTGTPELHVSRMSQDNKDALLEAARAEDKHPMTAADVRAQQDRGLPKGDGVAKLRSTLGHYAERLDDQEYLALLAAGYDTPELLLGARETSLRSLSLRAVAVDAVLDWQEETRPQASG